jgi:hypothetical protein
MPHHGIPGFSVRHRQPSNTSGGRATLSAQRRGTALRGHPSVLAEVLVDLCFEVDVGMWTYGLLIQSLQFAP